MLQAFTAMLPCLLLLRVCPHLAAVHSPRGVAGGLNASSGLKASVDKDVPLLWQGVVWRAGVGACGTEGFGFTVALS